MTGGKATPIRRIENSPHKEFTDAVLNSVIALAHESACMGYGVLVFAGSRGMCESDARWISRVMPQPHELAADVLDKRMSLLGDLRSLSTGVDPVLEESVLHGVAFHRESLSPNRSIGFALLTSVDVRFVSLDIQGCS